MHVVLKTKQGKRGRPLYIIRSKRLVSVSAT